MSVPLLGEISLEYVQRIEHDYNGGFVATRIAGLPGELQQNAGRLSHRIAIQGLLVGEGAAEALQALQQAAAEGAELSFAADISAALDLQQVVIATMRAVEMAGRPGHFSYELVLVESPPLPPPAELSGFGGLDDFGLGDLGFDSDLLGDLEDLAGEVAGAVDAALGVIDQLAALSNLANLDALQVGNVLEPISRTTDSVGELASRFKDAARQLGELFG